jgi:hypothetical protein
MEEKEREPCAADWNFGCQQNEKISPLQNTLKTHKQRKKIKEPSASPTQTADLLSEKRRTLLV